jgi:hypothetical protein
MAEDPNGADAVSNEPLSERATRYKKEVERVVREVGEHPLFELKRSYAPDDLESKIEFIKDIQSICTSKIESQRCLVIGADARTREFFDVSNLADFDDAKIRLQLEKYLEPVPQFEVLLLRSSDGANFVLFVFPRQRTRRILARVTVEQETAKGRKVLIREGDLWTKGESTGKRLATSKDWDDIYEDAIELETERRTRQRTAHFLERVTAEQRLHNAQGLPSVPSATTDEELRILVEGICISQDRARFAVLLEDLRDDLVEGWHSINAFGPVDFSVLQASFPDRTEQVRNHKKNIFLPAMRRLTAAAIYLIKYGGPADFMGMVVSLCEEVYGSSNQLAHMRWMGPRGLLSAASEEHLSHTVPALETLAALHLVGAYATKRNRLVYLAPILRTVVREAGGEGTRDVMMPIALWPLARGWGEPRGLQVRAGRINFCMEKARTDPVLLKLFGSETTMTGALCSYELILELNSFLAVDTVNSPKSAAFIKRQYPDVAFGFWPSLIAFPLENISSLSLNLVSAIRRNDQELLRPVLFDPSLVSFLTEDRGATFAKLLQGLQQDRGRLQWELRMLPDGTVWPKEVAEAIANVGKRDSGAAAKG